MMKKIMMLTIVSLAISGIGQTNLVENEKVPSGEARPKRQGDASGERRHKNFNRMSPDMREKMDERRLQLMETTLKDIGVTDEQKAEILALQTSLKKEMGVKSQAVNEAREKLSTLQKEGAEEEALFTAIDELMAAQGAQMKLLVRDKIEMKRILGEEKYKAFMESARTKWREHGRRGGGPGLPPRPPGLPPIPGQDGNKGEQPPLPPTN